MRTTRNVSLMLLAALGACKMKGDSSADKEAPRPMAVDEKLREDRNGVVASTESAPGYADDGKMGKKDAEEDKPADVAAKQRSQGQAAFHAGLADRKEAAKNDKKAPDKGEGGGAGGSEGESATRAWFPESFLFEPLVVTDDAGNATVSVRVPDRLTTWRVLALAHSRTGAQAGAVTSFLGTLPTYVDPIVPKRLVIGDKVRMPIQLVNTTQDAVKSSLSIRADGATIAGANGAERTLPAEGSLVEYATLTASSAGQATVRVGLGSTDAVQRGIQILPSGKPVVVTRTGTLAQAHELDIEGITGADAQTDRVRLMAFPGALALVRSELSISTARAGVADDAYALLLAGKATQLLSKLGDKADPEVVRNMAILAGQRAMRDARTLDVAHAGLLVEASLAHPNNPVMTRLGERAADYLAKAQRPDGTFSGETGWTLQRVLVATADATRAVASAKETVADRQRAMNVSAKSAGAFERNLDRVEDGYTAAAILASGAVSPETAAKLKKIVLAHVATAKDGSKYLDVGEGVVRADGTVPSRALATALAVLALDGTKDAPVSDLGATLLGSYDPERGWGDGVDNLACISAIVQLFKDPIPANVKIVLEMDGKVVTTGTLSPEKLKDVLVLDAPAAGLASQHKWTVHSEPAVPGLGFSLALEAWTPWEKEATNQGLELSLADKMAAKVGKPVDVAIEAIAPAGMEVHFVQALPAGVQIDRPSVEALVSAGQVERFDIADGKLEMWLRPLQPGQTFQAKYRAIPTLAGTLHAAASSIEANGTTFHVPPVEWTISE